MLAKSLWIELQLLKIQKQHGYSGKGRVTTVRFIDFFLGLSGLRNEPQYVSFLPVKF